jgi:hypothetical protein
LKNFFEKIKYQNVISPSFLIQAYASLLAKDCFTKIALFNTGLPLQK